MLLATRCPFCESVFRILPAQLAVRRGLVRCGHCQETFDASGSLYEMPEGVDFAQATPVAPDIAASLAAAQGTQRAASTQVPPPQVERAVAPEATGTAAPNFSNRGWDPWAPRPDSRIDPNLQFNADHLPRASLAAGAAPRPTQGVEMRAIHDDEPTLTQRAEPQAPPARPAAPAEPVEPTTRWTRVEPGRSEPSLSANEANPTSMADPEPVFRRQAAAATAAPAFAALDPDDRVHPFAVTREAPVGAKRSTGWRVVGVLIALALVALLVLQLGWWQREKVMVAWPASQSLYQQACAQFGCHVKPPRDIDGLQVEPSDLRQVDDPHHLELKVPLHNRFDLALAYPAIELTLLDRQNNIIVRRVLWPQDYAPPGTRIDAGLPARSTQTMIVRLDTGNLVASNFRLEIFYP
jgi:predicted Zn finger-like uncharacterized protein